MNKQNVIVIMSDEHTRSVMGAYGNPLAQTPTLDKLANAGVRFTCAYTPSPICISARASFATGTNVFEHRCWSSAEPYYGQQESWMHRLRDRGSKVVSIGKLHYRSKEDDLGFTDQQLPMYVANHGIGWPQALQRKPLPKYHGASELAADIGPGETTYTQYDRDITKASIEWLKKQTTSVSDIPWVLFVSFICPHYPLSAPQKFYDMYRDVELLPPYDCDPEKQLKHPVIDAMREFWNYNDYFTDQGRIEGLRNYYGLCSFLDDNIRQILETLDDSKAKNNTQIIYTSDHGDLVGNHGIWCKSYMYEDSVGIPLTLTGPGIEPGVNNTPVSLIDLSATIEYTVTGKIESTQQKWRSRPLQSFLENPEENRPIISEYHDGGSPCGIFMLRKNSWKYVYYPESNPDLLFDIESDPQELHNLSGDPAFQPVRNDMLDTLYGILDPEKVNKNALSDQALLTEKLGGIEKIQQMESFNHTPVD